MVLTAVIDGLIGRKTKDGESKVCQLDVTVLRIRTLSGLMFGDDMQSVMKVIETIAISAMYCLASPPEVAHRF